MVIIAFHFNAGIILVVTVWRQLYNLLLPQTLYPLPPFPPSLISLMVSVDVKHHVYLTHYLHFQHRFLAPFSKLCQIWLRH